MDSKDVWAQFEKDKLDPEVYTPGKPLEDEDGKLKFYKSYWLITTNGETPKIETIKNEDKGIKRILKFFTRRIR